MKTSKYIQKLLVITTLLLSFSSFLYSQGQITSLKANDAEFIYVGETASHQVVDSIISYGTYPNGERIIVTKEIRLRDYDGIVSREISYITDGFGKLVNKLRKTNQIEDRKIIECLFEEWDDEVEVYFDYMKYKYSYLDNDICIAYRYYKDTNDAWILQDSTRIQTVYNSNMDPVEITTAVYRPNINQWQDSVMESYDYDAEFKLTSKNKYVWDGISWRYLTAALLDYSTDDNSIARVKEQNWNGYSWENLDYQIGNTNTRICKYIYTTVLTKTLEEETTEKQKVNKKNKRRGFYINAGNSNAIVYVTGPNGKIYEKENISGTKFINLETLDKGIYIIKIIKNGKTISRKLKVD